jgi:NAD(P)-dependent dehydrogenase (short-subunit alcohol dehydrogenase family)
MKLFEKRAIISGASQGLGATIAACFVKEGASVVICGRNKTLLLQQQIHLKKLVKNNHTEVIAVIADISSPHDVAQLREVAENKLGGVDILIANAGIYGPKGYLETNVWEEWSHAIDVNLKGTVLQCREIIPLFKKQKHGKIIIISGGGATKPLPNFSAYAASKAAVVRFAETLALELFAFNIDVNAIAPGALNTRMLDEVLQAGPQIVGENCYQQAMQQKQAGGHSLELAAQLCVYLATHHGISGKLISAVWDPWQNLHEKYSEIADNDIYTLRRIIPEDRKKDWGNPR